MASLIVYMNGARVGEWGTLRGGTQFFRYDETWMNSRRARPLSLSLPFTSHLELRGHKVAAYFDNLLPDNPVIRARIRQRFGAPSTEAFDLLTAIGRDCIGAVQLLPEGQEPAGWDQVDARPLSDADVEQILRDVTAGKTLGREELDEFRISLAGAQEKTALLQMGNAWFRPGNATPTTHILKLPLGVVGNFPGDFSDSVENEWLCAQFLQALELPVAETRLATFGEQRVLVITRFDRRWQGVDATVVAKKGFKPRDGMWIARLPQEDFCQATGRPPTQKYETDGGPSTRECLSILANSENADIDRANFVLAQLAFWLLAATDGHAKNFSIHHRLGGNYGLTPLYDVLSAWPIIGHGRNQLPIEKVRLAMALRGKRPHYALKEIAPRHWQALAKETGIGDMWSRMQQLVAQAPAAMDSLEKMLPKAFPERVYAAMRAGIHAQARSFGKSAGLRPPHD